MARAKYDAALPNVGGLADPTAGQRFTSLATPPKPSVAKSASVASSQRADAWVCFKCQTVNPLKTKFCSKCGQQLGRNCPKCGSLTKSADPFCMECGTNVDEFIRNKENEEQARLKQERAETKRRNESALRSKADAQAKAQRSNVGCLIGCALIGIIIFFGFIFFGALANQFFEQVSRTNTSSGGAPLVIFPTVAPTSTTRAGSATATAQAMIGKWSGNTIDVQSRLISVQDERFEIRYAVSNRTSSKLIIAFKAAM